MPRQRPGRGYRVADSRFCARSCSLVLESRAAMDLLEYQGKQLFARHGLQVSSGKP